MDTRFLRFTSKVFFATCDVTVFLKPHFGTSDVLLLSFLAPCLTSDVRFSTSEVPKKR